MAPWADADLELSPPMTVWVLGGAAALALVSALFIWFLRLERHGGAISLVIFTWAVLLLDAAVYPGFDSPAGILHPTVSGVSFRLPDVILPLALLARLAVRGWPERIGVSLLWWAAFAVWYAFQGVVGTINGHPLELVLFEAKAIVYVAGGILLAAGVPASEYVSRRGLPRLVKAASVLAVVLLVTDQLGVSVVADIPLFPLERLGEMGAAAASLFATLGVIAFTMAACTTERQGLLLAAAPLLMCPLASEQRAALLALLVALVVLAVTWLVTRERRRFTITPTEAALLGLAVLALFLAPSLGRGATAQVPAVNPFAEELRASFTSRAKAQSAESRANQWAKASEMVRDRPFLGWGLGKEYWHYEEGPDEFWKSNITHNVGLDVWLRSGVLGLGLLLVALGGSLADAPRTWRSHRDPKAAALALACAAGAIGLLARGMVESILEEYLLATTLGLLLGTVRAAATSLDLVVDDAAAPVPVPPGVRDPWT